MERRLAAILAGDVVGYSRLMAEDEAGTYDSLRSGWPRSWCRPSRRMAAGCSRPPAMAFWPSSPASARRSARPWPSRTASPAAPLQLRLGLNLGDVIEENGDVFGDGVNVAARLEAMAEPGTIYASAAVVRGAGRDPASLRPARHAPGQEPARRRSRSIQVQRGAVARAGLGRWQVAAAAAAAAAGPIRRRGLGLSRAAGHTPSTRRTVAARGGSAPMRRPAVAVLPFDNLGGDPGQDYFTDGLTEDIITELARNPRAAGDRPQLDLRLQGPSRPTSVTSAPELGAGYVVEGSARRAGDQLRSWPS